MNHRRLSDRPAVPNPAGPDPNPRHVETPQLEYIRVMRHMTDLGFSLSDMRDEADRLDRRFAAAFSSCIRECP